MMVIFTCPNCGKELRVRKEYAGQKGVCKHCGAQVQVPQEEPVPAAAVPEAAPAASGFDDIAQSIAASYDPAEQVTETKQDEPGKKRKVAAPVKREKMNPLFLAIPVLIVLAGISWYYFGQPLDPPPIPEELLEEEQPLDQVMTYLTDNSIFPNVSWVDVRGNEVVIGWTKKDNIPGGEVPPGRVLLNAAITASEAARGRVTVYLVDTAQASQSWQPGQAGLIDQKSAEMGQIIN